jgi:soluble P-type ATPase
MLRIEVPQRGLFELHHAVFDINGTLAVDGQVLPGVRDRLHTLADLLAIHLLTAGTHGQLAELEHTLGYPLQLITTGEEKARYVEQLGAASVIAFGNGTNDIGMLEKAAIGVAVLSAEGLASKALQVADMLAFGPVDALDLVLKPQRLVATLRG